MLREFALDPDLLSNWQDFRFFASQFGTSQGRLISRFPKHWKRLVVEAVQAATTKAEAEAETRVKELAVNLGSKAAKEVGVQALDSAVSDAVRDARSQARSVGDIEFQRIVEALSSIDALMLISSRNYDGNKQWLENAIAENSTNPFHAILSNRNIGQAANLVIGEDLVPTKMPELIVVPTSVHITREPKRMAECIESLLSQCNEVIFVDPYFGPGKRQHTEPLKLFLNAIANRGNRRMPNRIEYHCGNQYQDRLQFQKDLDQWIKPNLPNGAKLKVVRWTKDELHNRYVLTDRGGVIFGHGLDCDFGQPASHDTVSLLDDRTCAQLVTEYSPKSPRLTWLNDTFTTG
jgi:hypothetical protein